MKLTVVLFKYGENNFYLGLVLDLSTSNVIEIPIPELIKQGLIIAGRYVCRRQTTQQEYLKPRLELLGQVSAIHGQNLLLTDTEGENEVSASETLLEPRFENLNDVIRLYYGSKSNEILSTLNELRKPISTAIGKLDGIRSTLQGLKKRPIIIANGLSVVLGNFLQSHDGKFPNLITTERPSLLFGPQGRDHGPYPDAGINNYGPYMYMQHERNSPLIAVVCESQFRGRVEQFLSLLRDGFPNNKWRSQNKNNPYPQGIIGKYRIAKFRIEIEESKNESPEAFREAAKRLLLRLPEMPDIAIVQIREAFMRLSSNFNPYFVSKAAFMQAGVPVQAIRIEKMESKEDNLPYILNQVSLAIYAKLDGIPWVMSTLKPSTHEIVVGLGATEVRRGRLGQKTRYVGITSVFQGDGRYLLWGLTREVEFEEYADALLQSLKAVVTHVQQQNAWQQGDRVRLVCHVYKPLKDQEVITIKDLVRDLVADKFQVEFAFLDISWTHLFHIFDPQQRGVKYWDFIARGWKTKGAGVPQRGVCLQLDDYRGLLHLTGPTDIKTDLHGIPKPLLAELHHDSDFRDMTYLLRQIYNFSFMSWRSYFPSTEPVTISYSRQIAKLLGNIRSVDGWNTDVLSVGSLRDRRWFL